MKSYVVKSKIKCSEGCHGILLSTILSVRNALFCQIGESPSDRKLFVTFSFYLARCTLRFLDIHHSPRDCGRSFWKMKLRLCKARVTTTSSQYG